MTAGRPNASQVRGWMAAGKPNASCLEGRRAASRAEVNCRSNCLRLETLSRGFGLVTDEAGAYQLSQFSRHDSL